MIKSIWANRRNRIIIGIPVLIVLIAGGILLSQVLQGNQKINQAQLVSLAGKGDCATGLKTVASERVDSKDPTGSIALLRYRATCYEVQNEYPKAISDLEELNELYMQRHDTANLTATTTEITSIKNAEAQPRSTVNNHDTVPAGLAEGINSLRQQ
jgi:hypothetical protein